MSLWTDFGFRANPYSATPIPPTAQGARLLVGREKALARLVRGITSADTVPTIEGDNGVGKTSLVAVAAYTLRESFREGDTTQLFLPLDESFQLLPGSDLETFETRLYRDIARAFVRDGATIKGAGLHAPDHRELERLLADDGASGDVLRAKISDCLSTTFPSREQGGFVCVIDNLELLETSQIARQQLEALRELLVVRPGMRWILCGARGIVRSAASSARLNGVLSEPVELGPVSEIETAEVVRRRIEAFQVRPDAFIPVDAGGFQHIYRVLNRNLRDALKYCEDFAFWLDAEGERPSEAGEPFTLLEVWLADRAQRYLAATGNVKPRAWKVFDDLVALGGTCSPSDFEAFEFNSSMAMRPHVKDLEDANLVVSSVSDSDQRRKHIGLTSRGWLVNYQRSGYAS